MSTAQRNNAINIRRQFYNAESDGEGAAEITMYGDIVESRPFDFYTGAPIEGQFIIQDEFLADLDAVVANGARNITLRINSLGGDAGVSITIHNRLRELANKGITVACVVDGVAMSGGALIMSACDPVRVYPASLIMIHKALLFLVGHYNADELRTMAQQNDAWDSAQVNIFRRKCKLSDTVISHMMSETTYMTGREAVEKGFADELIEGGGLDVAASADRRSIIIGGRAIPVHGAAIPDSIPVVAAANADVTNINTPDTNTGNEGGSLMANNLTELREENPALATAIEAEIRAAVLADRNTDDDALRAAVEGERNRIREIDEISANVDASLVSEAKYGATACTAQELAYRVMKQNAGAAPAPANKGAAFLGNMIADHAASGAGSVPAASPKDDVIVPQTHEEKMAAASSDVKSLLGKEEK